MQFVRPDPVDSTVSVKSVNRTDAVTLLGTFKTLSNIITASPDDLALCPGFGPNKAKKLHKVFSETFRRNRDLSQGRRGDTVTDSRDIDDED